MRTLSAARKLDADALVDVVSEVQNSLFLWALLGATSLRRVSASAAATCTALVSGYARVLPWWN